MATRRKPADPPPVERGRGARPSVERSRDVGAYRLRLSIDAIVDATLRIIDTDGVDEVSMRRVAAEFGTGPASLYAHVANKEALLRLAHDKVVAELRFPDHEDWREVVRGWAHASRRLYQQHNDLAKLSFANIPSGERMLETVETLLAAMIGRGKVPPRVATWAMDAMSTYVAADAYEGYLLGQAYGDDSGRGGAPAVEEMVAEVRESFGLASADRFPFVHANLETLMTGDSDERFSFGIDLFIAGLELHAGRGEG